MKIQILSDLHREFFLTANPTREEVLAWSKMKNALADVTILAGDTHTEGRGIELAARMFPDRQIVMVCGNHELYGQVFPQHIDSLKEKADKFENVHFLENDVIEINGVVFLGCTLWTDCKLWETGPFAGLYSYNTTLMNLKMRMNDYARIIFSDGHQYRRLLPEDLIEAHSRSVRWLRAQFEKLKGQKFVVVTHHAPTCQSVPKEYSRDVLSAAFASHLDELVADSGATYWIHGHNHRPSDYKVGKTRVLVNPMGYPGEGTQFKPGLVVKI
jgi:predicted phosphodiesterase